MKINFAGFILLLSLLSALSAQTLPGRVIYVSYEDARPVFQALEQDMPAAASWPQWAAQSDRDIRARLREGDETSLVNLVLFGTSFTRQPRITSRQIEDIHRINQALDARLNDFVQAVARPVAPDNERLLFAQRMLAGEAQIKQFLLSALARRLQEEESFADILKQAQALGDPSLEFAERSSIYRTRGLSSDTSLRTNFAVEEALQQLQRKGILKAGIARVAIVGPGLDFTDKQDGYDFYPVQTIQPFAVIDSLMRLGLAKGSDIHVTAFDLSPRINDHLDRASANARQGMFYVVQLPLDARVRWTRDLRRYWETFGDQIGTPVKPVTIPAGAGDVKLRAVRVRPLFAATITPEDLNIVLQHRELPEAEQFDLIVGTNIFVYYDRLHQGLAMVNIGKMLRPGGLLLSNNALLELPATRLKSVGYSKTLYSDRSEDGDLVLWYQRLP